MTATVPSPTAAPAVPGCDIKLGLPLYSLTSEWAAGRYDLAGLLDAVDTAGIGPGIEIVASQTIRTYPLVTDEFVRLVDAQRAKAGKTTRTRAKKGR